MTGAVLWSVLFASDGLTFPLSLAAPDCPGDEVSCDDAVREEREIKKTKAGNGQVTNFIDKHFS